MTSTEEAELLIASCLSTEADRELSEQESRGILVSLLKTMKDDMSNENACRQVKSVFEDKDKKLRDQMLDAFDFKVIGELMLVGLNNNFTVGVDHPNIWPVWNMFTVFFDFWTTRQNTFRKRVLINLRNQRAPITNQKAFPQPRLISLPH